MKKIALIVLILWAFMGYAQSDKEAQREIAEKYVQALKDKDFATIDNLFDYDGAFEIISSVLSAKMPKATDQKKQYIKNLKYTQKLYAGNPYITLMGERKVDGFSGFVFRLVSEDYSPIYMGLIYKKSHNNWKIVDYYDFARKERYTQMLKGALGDFLDDEDLKEIAKKDKSEMQKMNVFFKYFKERNYDKAIVAYRNLSEAFQKTELALMAALTITGYFSDDETFYDEVLLLVKKYHANNPRFNSWLIDYYLLKKDYAKARKHLGSFIESVGADAMTSVIEAGISLGAKEYPRALKESHECVARESDFKPCYDVWVTSASKMKNYTEVVKAYDTMLENTGGSLTKSLFNEEEDGDFVHSEAFKNWDIPEE